MEQVDRTFAQMVVARGLASQQQVDECAQIVDKVEQLGATTSLADTMVKKGYVSREQADALLAEIRRGDAKVKSIAGYELISKLGGGAMRTVYKARQTAAPGQ
jgi:hypothetical protein